MYGPDTPLPTNGVRPVVEAGGRGGNRAEDAGTDEQVGGLLGTGTTEDVQHRRHAPGADRQVGEHGMGGMAQIRTAEQVTDRARLHGLADQSGHRLGDLVQRGEAFNAAHQRLCKRHD